MIVGMDFGTTNSGMAVYDGRSVTVLPLDPDSPNPRVLRTAIYVTNEQTVHIGRTAVNQYFSQNIGRPVKMRRVWIGEIEVIASEVYYVTDAYAWVDVLSPGRLFLSVKTSLRDQNYPGTVVGRSFYSLENLIALYLTVVKTRAEKMLGQELKEVVLGRPVRFARDHVHDQLAQDRLLQAAFAAGYETVYLQQEPVAAAYSYETTLNRPENALVFDFGGGTLDLTVMRLGDAGQPKVLATGGIPVAGDVFDQKLVRAKLPRHFGEGSFHGPRHKRMTPPRWIYDAFSDWQRILELQAAENRKILEEIARTAQRRHQFEALLSLVSGNYGLKMFDIVERAKRTLSEKRGAEILLEGEGFHVRDFVTRTEFERIIGADIRAIDAHVDEVVAASGLEPGAIDRVIRTGGSAQIPAFREMLARKFGADKALAVDTFSSVTAGLGVMAYGIERGEIDGRAFSPDDITWARPAEEHRPNVPPVNLAVALKRIALAEGNGERKVESGQRMLVLIGGGEGVTAVPFAGQDTVLPAGDWAGGVAADFDEQLLFITTHYRFILMTPRQLAELQTAGLQLADAHRLERQESVCAVIRWAEITAKSKLLLVTSAGLARPYPTHIMRHNIEVPVPLRFDQPLDGVAVAALAAEPADWLTLISQKGRGARWRVADLRGSGTQAFNCGSDDRVMAATLAAEMAMVTADGYGRRLPASRVPAPPKPNTKGKSLIARRSPVAAVWDTAVPAWLVTSTRMARAEDGRLPRQDSTKTEPLIKLAPGERVCGAVQQRRQRHNGGNENEPSALGGKSTALITASRLSGP